MPEYETIVPQDGPSLSIVKPWTVGVDALVLYRRSPGVQAAVEKYLTAAFTRWLKARIKQGASPEQIEAEAKAWTPETPTSKPKPTEVDKLEAQIGKLTDEERLAFIERLQKQQKGTVS